MSPSCFRFDLLTLELDVMGDNCVHVVKTADVEKQNECTKTERNIERGK